MSNPSLTPHQVAEKEKASAAMSSVLAAVALTTIKIVVGLATNSLGILAEAAHSGLDLVAALVTYFAVRFSGKPADRAHQYGHGKIENLSALVETVLLLMTSVWIIYESIRRLFFETVEVDVTIWAFLVMGISIVVDATRSRILYKAARKHNSQALEADALHFSTDIWSSSVVILGLIGIKVAEAIPALNFLHKADAVAALIVAGIVIYVSIQLGARTVQGLLDHSPTGLAQKIEETVLAVPGVLGCHKIRVRTSGPRMFIDLHIFLDPEQTLKQAHSLAHKVADKVREIVPGSDVIVHPEPSSLPIPPTKDGQE